MPYTIVPIKVCSECGQVLDSVREDYCDGCGIKLDQIMYRHHVRIDLMPNDSDKHLEDKVYHNLACFIEHANNIPLEEVDNVSIMYMSPRMFHSLLKSIKTDGG